MNCEHPQCCICLKREFGAREQKRPRIDLISFEEETRIRELIAANTWPRGWYGTEAEGDALIDRINADGTLQPLIAGLV